MKTIYIGIISLLLALITAACDNTMSPDSPQSSIPDGTPIEIVTGAEFPEMEFARSSRSMGEQPSIDELFNELKVNLFVFDESGVMLQFIEPKDINIVRIDEQTKQVFFKITNIYSSSRRRRLHFIITSADDLRSISGGEYINAMASEHTTMPALVADNGTDAYWGHKDVEQITEDMALTVKLIRNFVKISAKSSVSEDVFKLLGYTVVNRPNRGTIAPYIYRDHLFASFFDNFDDLLSYEDVIAQGYYGVNPSGVDESMTHTTEAEVRQSLNESENLLAAGEADTPCYIYERSQSGITHAGNDVMVTYMIVVGEYNGKRCYYKIDIGRDKEGKFGFYDLLRNFQYLIEITEVGGEGAPTLLDAMNGAAHNNLSTSVVTRDLFSIGYDGEKIEVSSTRVIFTEKTTDYYLRFRYTTPSDMAFDPSKFKIYNTDNENVEYDMSGVAAGSFKNIDLQGTVIESSALTRDADGWYMLRISTKDIPTDSRRLEQNITIYYNGGNVGLGRTITLMLRRPWDFSNVTASSPEADLLSDLSINFDLPSGLSQSQFPMIITFESDKQNIYGQNGTQLTVATGKSNFKGATTDDIIYYEWRIEWSEYEAGNTDLTARFGMNTTSNNDTGYNTAAIDSAAIDGRNNNNGTRNFCIRIANKGQKYIQPYYINVTRNR